MKRTLLAAGLLGLLAGPALSAPSREQKLNQPSTQKSAATDTYHGVTLTEDYRWLEGEGPDVIAWINQQNEWTRSKLDAAPHRKEIAARIATLESQRPPDWFGLQYEGGQLFAEKLAPPREQPYLVAFSTPGDPSTEKIVLDPLTIDPSGNTAIDWFVPSLDGKYLAVSLSVGGSEDGTLHVYETATGKPLPDVIPRVQYGTGGGSVAWAADGSLFYTRYPAPGERSAEDAHFYQQIYRHKLGTAVESDTYSLGASFPKIAEIELAASEDGKYVLANVKNGDGGEAAQWLHDGSSWRRLTFFSSQVVGITFGLDGNLYALSRYKAPRGQILRMPLRDPDLDAATVVVPESEAVIVDFVATKSRLFVTTMKGGPTELWSRSVDGGDAKLVPTLPVSSVGGLVRLSNDEVLYRNTSYVDPGGWYRLEGGTPKRTGLATNALTDWSGVEVVRAFATSKDGTKVPMSILKKKGLALDGKNPTILNGYGGYGVNMNPGFREHRQTWLEQGGVWVIANLRGGGEYGDDWHLQGNLTKKQNVFDDFAACADWLIAEKYTSSEHLAVMGGSNGGLLMGAFLTQHPDKARAVVATVGIFDMLRVELSPNGLFNVTEFGTVKDKAQFDALYAYSPLHHVKDGTAYPAVLLTTGMNDPRVEPSQSRKMAARLQEATSSEQPVLLRTSFKAGHGMGSSLTEQIALQTDVFSFLFWQLGVDYQPVVAGKKGKKK